MNNNPQNASVLPTLTIGEVGKSKMGNKPNLYGFSVE